MLWCFGGDNLQIIESFIEGKTENRLLCEDALVVTGDFIAVVDGVTGKTNRTFDGLSGGKAAASKVCECVENFSADIDCCTAVEKITESIKSLYEENKPDGTAAAGAIIFSKARKEIWSVGDCRCIINGELFTHEKEIDVLLSGIRSLVLESEKRKGKTLEDLKKNDSGREFILPLLKCQHIFANTEGEFSYGIFNGDKIPEDKIVIYKVKDGDEIVLASDGYPYLEATLKESEARLREEIKNNPLCDGDFRSTKGLAEGNSSFDDRTYIRFKV